MRRTWERFEMRDRSTNPETIMRMRQDSELQMISPWKRIEMTVRERVITILVQSMNSYDDMRGMNYCNGPYFHKEIFFIISEH